MRLGLYGGSFDPIHRGHVEPVRTAMTALDLDRVVFLPTAEPPHKRDQRLAPALRRYAMVELALLDEPGFEVSTFELEHAGPSYTVETLEHVRRVRPDDALFLILGADSFASLTRWHRFAELPTLARLVVLRRGGADDVPPREAWHPALRAADHADRLHFIDNPHQPASSTEIRRRLRTRAAIPAGWMAPTVLSYIEKYGLYSAASTRVDALSKVDADS